jgi:hypothetical protein
MYLHMLMPSSLFVSSGSRKIANAQICSRSLGWWVAEQSSRTLAQQLIQCLNQHFPHLFLFVFLAYDLVFLCLARASRCMFVFLLIKTDTASLFDRSWEAFAVRHVQPYCSAASLNCLLAPHLSYLWAFLETSSGDDNTAHVGR